jgi:hypothetical protein
LTDNRAAATTPSGRRTRASTFTNGGKRHLGAIVVAGSGRDALAPTLSNLGSDERTRFSKYSIFVAKDEGRAHDREFDRAH